MNEKESITQALGFLRCWAQQHMADSYRIQENDPQPEEAPESKAHRMAAGALERWIRAEVDAARARGMSVFAEDVMRAAQFETPEEDARA